MLSDAEFKREHANVVSRTGGHYLQLHLAMTRGFNGDLSAACVMAYFLNLLRVKMEHKRDNILLKKNNMAFRCPAKQTCQKLNIGVDKERAATNKLVSLGLVEVTYRKGNIRWIRVNTDQVKQLKKRGNQDTGKSRIRNGEIPDLRETGKSRFSIDTRKNVSKKQKEECSQSANASPASRDSASRATNEKGGFFPDGKKQPSKFDKDCAQLLYAELERKGLTKRKPAQRKTWPMEFRDLRETYNDDTERIQKALKWYISHLHLISTTDTPEIYSAKCFREKFEKVEGAMRREANKRHKKEEERDLGW